MKLGMTIGHHGERLDETAAVARRAEKAGLDLLGIGDSPALFRELYVELAVCAAATSSVLLGPMVTNPLTRHPHVTASAAAAIDELSGGRAFLGIGTGASGVAAAGIGRATPDELRAAVTAVRAAFASRRQGHAIPLAWAARRPPIVVHASGPKTLRVAHEEGDGAVLRLGDLDRGALIAQVAAIRDARAAGRRGDEPFEVWLYAPAYVSGSTTEARTALAGTVSARLRTLQPSQAPSSLADAVRRYVDGYDYAHHASNETPVNVRLMERLGLADYAFERFALAGDEPTVAEHVREFAASGFDAVVVAGGVVDKPALIEGLVAARAHVGVKRSRPLPGMPVAPRLLR